jgi:site-specific DNA-methyltransferase (adenine-specific)
MAFTRYASSHDIIFYYAKGEVATWNAESAVVKYDIEDLDVKTDGKYSLRSTDGRRYQLTSLLNPNPNRPNLTYEFLGVRRVWRWTRERMEEAYAAGLVVQPRPGGVPRFKRYLDVQRGKPIGDIWDDIPPINSQAQERLGYPTQKPVALLERIISAASNEGDLVLDPFCGCGTTIHAAQKLNRHWIGIDITHLAIALVERRLQEAFPGIAFDVHGVPNDVAGARNLAERDKHEFQKWIAAKIGAQPFKGGKKGMDRGIDGYLHFRDADKKPQFAIVSVKGGGIKSGDIRDLKGTMEREKAMLGLFLALNPPTREMEREAASAGIYETGGMKVPRLQILTAAEILDNRRPQVPFGFTEGFRKAGQEKEDRQPKLL